MVFMNATVEIDKAGRIVVPKKVRDALGLNAGTQVELEVQEDAVVLRAKRQPKGLWNDRGLWVYDAGVPITTDEVQRWMDELRERRMRFVSGESLEP
ncbi:looped-hinge helix DNA binding domain-containing protein, AbrB family [Bryocella elongata]|uniref:Looped-hinge helix DNA binding domain-containing protein, AbrB family n=2 Tax=Bryocella elongata TaxID=863522 RepID=A0A1H6A237_9BACT|nr:looped-hinge helix DNA binding domain-containing protein, AbrB family [Bryocella elongata]